MIYSGLCSVTFRKQAPEQLVDLVAQAKLDAIEWGGDVHVPTSDLTHAQKVGRMTLEKGLQVASYGSYYRLVKSEEENQPFEWHLETAVALGAPMIRVWAGTVGSAEATESYRNRVVDESRRIAALAEEEGIVVSYEFHGNTLTDTTESAVALLKAVDHPNMRSYWQPPSQGTVEDALASLQAVQPWLTNLHVHHFPTVDGERQRLALSEGEERWDAYLQEAASAEDDRFALIEFVCDDTSEQFLRDANALRGWLAEIND